MKTCRPIGRRRGGGGKTPRLPVIAAACGLLLTAGLPAAAPAENPAEKNLADLSLEELLNESVTSVAKREQKLADAAAAVAVLTTDDLRRTGAAAVPDALRLIPGLDVGAVNSRETAVGARGFNFVFSNKLLVLVDGRTVYTPLFSGTYWDLQQVMLEDVDRIEVIRGPGATIWGANAVNGVIDIVTESARDTQGGLLYAGGGDLHRVMSGLRYGGQLGPHTYYRVFASYQSNDDDPFANGQPAHDHWQGRHAGFRLDRYPDPSTQLMWQAETTRVESGFSDGYNVNTVGRWTRQLSPRSNVELQAYYDRTFRDETNRSRPITDIFDVTAQQTLGLGERHDAIWGMGYRSIANDILQTSSNALVRDQRFNQQLVTAFVQDEWKPIPNRLALTAGLKVEHHDVTGVELQPSVRAAFKPAEQQTLWAAISRAVRTPSEVEGNDVFAIVSGGPFVGPNGAVFIPAFVGNPAIKSEVLWACELGYRIRPSKRVSVDTAGFYNRYRDLISYGPFGNFVPGTPVGLAEIPWLNLLAAESYGAEASVTVSPVDRWRLTAAYSFIHLAVSGPPNAAGIVVQQPPRHQFSLRSSYDFSRRVSLDAQLRCVDAIPSVPAYTTADLRLAFRPSERLELSLVGQNLFARRHLEQAEVLLTTTTEVPRQCYGKLTWRF